MKLQAAFTERKRLTNAISSLVSELETTPLVVETTHEEKPESTFDEKWETLRSLTDTLATFNAAIDRANGNSMARELLSQIDGTNRLINLLECSKRQLKNFKPEVRDFDSYEFDPESGTRGKYVTRTYEKMTNMDIDQELKSLLSKKMDLEDQLLEVNVTTVVDVPEGVLKVLQDIRK